MTRYLFNWTISGSTFIEASCTAEAQTKFDEMSSVEMEKDGDFSQDQILVEVEPSIFEETEE